MSKMKKNKIIDQFMERINKENIVLDDRKPLFKCICGSNNVSIESWYLNDIIRCHDCGLIQEGKVTEKGFESIICHYCGKPIIINEKDKLYYDNMSNKMLSKKYICYKLNNIHVCYNCVRLNIYRIIRYIEKLEEEEMLRTKKINDEKYKERFNNLNKISKEELIKKIIELEDETILYENCY